MKEMIMVCVSFLVFLSNDGWSQNSVDRQNQYLKETLKINIEQRFRKNTRRVSVQDSTWKDWLHRSGELPPDFSKMRSMPMLPKPLMQNKDGRDLPITTANEWEEKRAWIKSAYQQWNSGHAPTQQGKVKSEILKDTLKQNEV